MKKTLLTLALLGLTSVAFSATVATVNGQSIDSSAVDNVVKSLVSQSKGQIKDTPQLREQLKNDLISRTILVQEAKKLKIDQNANYKKVIDELVAKLKKDGLDKDKDYAKKLEFSKENILIEFYQASIADKKKVSEQELKKAYDGYKKFYQGTEEIILGQIATNKEAEAKKALEELKKGAPFTTTAKKYTIIEEAKKSGGIMERAWNLKEVEALEPQIYSSIKDLKKGQYSSVIKSGDMYAIYYIQDRRKATIQTFNDSKKELEMIIKQDAVNAELSKVFDKADVK